MVLKLAKRYALNLASSRFSGGIASVQKDLEVQVKADDSGCSIRMIILCRILTTVMQQLKH